MKHLFPLLVFLFSYLLAQSQIISYDRPCYGIDAGIDSSICNNNCVTLNRKAIPQHENRSTSSYVVQEMTMPSPAYNTTGTNIIVGIDDIWGSVLNIGFNFCFFGNTYNKVVVGANGCVSFNTAYANQYCAYSFSGNIGTTTGILNSIMGPYTDIDPSISGGNINWYIEGTAPCRRFVINYYRIPMYSCNTKKHTSQIILHEGYNIIDVIIINKPVCSTWNGGRAIIGIQNSTGSINYTATGNNPSTTAQTNVCYRFLPSGPLLQSINWTDASGNIVSNSDVLSETICPNSTQTYTANLVNNRCDGTTVTVNDAATFKIDTLPNVSVNSPSICSGSTATLTASGANTYSWTGGLGIGNPKITPVLVANTTYTVTGTNTSSGCSNTAVANVRIGPPVVTVNSPSMCLGLGTTLTASGADNYSWSNGSTGASINVNPATTTTYTVTGTLTGCATPSAPATATVTVTGLPTVNAPSDQKICLGANTSAINFSGSAGATFNWTNNNPSIGLAASGTGNIPSFTSLAGGNATITVTPKIGTCVGNSQTFTINVLNTNATRLAPLGAQCSGIPLNFSSSPIGGNGTYTYAWGATSPISSGATNTFSYTPINSTNANITPTVTLNVTSNGLTCQQIFTPTIKPIPTVNTISNQTICVNTPTAAINFNGNIPTTTYTWLNNNTAIGLPASGTGNIASFIPTTTGVAIIDVSPSDNSCTGTSKSFTITVNPDATISLTSGSNNQTKCINNAITNIVYTIGGGGTGATVSGLPTGVTGIYNAGVFTISGIPTATGTFNYTVTTTGTCVQKSLSGTIIVNPDATISLTSGSNTPTKCINNAITNIVYTIGGGGTGATVSGLPTGVTGIYNAGVFTISGTPTATGTFNYTVTTTGTCVQKSLSGTIIVNPDATLSLTSGSNNQTKCINNAITNIVYTIGGGGTGATVTGLPTGITGVYNAGVFTISGTPTATGTFNYTVTTTGTCVQKSLSGTIIVNPDATISLTSGSNNQTKCINNAIVNIVYTIGGGGTGATVTGLPIGITGVYNAGVFTISGTPTAIGTFNYTVTTTGTCVQKSLTGIITVNPDATLTLTSGNNNQTKCINNAITNIVYTIGGGGTGATVTGLPTGITGVYNAGVFTISGTPTAIGTFNYTVTTTGTCVQKSLSGTIIVNPDASLALTSGSNTPTKCINNAITNIVYTIGGGGTGATVTGLPIGITGVYNAGVFTISGTPTATGTFNYTVTTTGTCVQKSLYGTITVNPDASLALTSGSNNQTKCINNAITNIVYTIGGGGTGATVTGLPAGITGVYNAGVFTISGTPTATGTFNYTVNTTGTCIQKSLSGTIIVNPDATLSLTSGSNNQTRCINNAITNIVYTIGGGGTGATVTGLPTGVTGIYNAGVFTISGTPTATGTFNYTVTTTGTCVQKSLSGTIIVNPDATISLTSGSNNQTKCINNAITNIVYTIGGGGTGATVTGLPTGITGVYNAGVFTISGTPTATGTFNYTVTTSGTCVQKSLTGIITVNPDATLTLTSGNNNQTRCINNAITNIVYTIGGGGTGATVSGLPTGITGVYNAGVFTISGTPTAIGTFNYTVTTTGTCVQKSLSGTITVNPDATISLTSGSNNQTKCINNAIVNIVYTIGGGGTGATVTGLPIGITGVYNAGVFTISGTPTAIGTFNYTVTTTGTCVQKILSGTITVNPDATLSLTSGSNNQTRCQGDAITNIVYTIGGGGTGATVTGLPTGVTGIYNAGVFTISGSPSESGTFNYTVTTTGNCIQKSLNGTIIVAPIVIPTVNIISLNNDVCPGGIVKIQANVNVASNYQWYVNSLPVGTNSNIFSSSTLNNGDVIKVITTTVVACTNPNTATSNSINAIVNSISYTKPTPAYCIKDSFLIDTTNMSINPLPNSNFTISWRNGSDITIDSVINYMVHDIVTTNVPFAIKYGNNCVINDAVHVVVHPLPIIDAVVDIPRAKYEEEVQLDVVTNATLQYNWLPSALVNVDTIKDPTSIITASTLFTVNVKDKNNCENTDTVFVELIDECQENYIYVPTAFSPNNDGLNDCFGIVSPPKLSDFKLVIFDRWGEKIFESTDKNTCWDGKHNGVDAMTDSYPYVISYKCYNGVNLSKKGILTIIR